MSHLANNDLQVDLVSIGRGQVPFPTPFYDMAHHAFINFAVQTPDGCVLRIVGREPNGPLMPLVWSQAEGGLSVQLYSDHCPRFVQAIVERQDTDNPCVLYIAYPKPDERLIYALEDIDAP